MSERPPEASHCFATLTPDRVLDAVEALGLRTDGRQFPLNSYENRVYQVGVDEGEPVIVKFYRHPRWSDEGIREEHEFVQALANQELSVVAPMEINGQTLHHVEEFRVAVFERRGGRAIELDNMDHLYQFGVVMGQLHNVGGAEAFAHRPTLSIQTFGFEAVQTVLAHAEWTKTTATAYESIVKECLNHIEASVSSIQINHIRVHGDCHSGNILWRDDLPHFVDFDDARMAPAVQDIWMMLSGDRDQQRAQMREILEGYEMFREFDRRELKWIEPLRTLRMIHHCAWLASRWHDPSFPMHFPWFNTGRFWGQHILELKEQCSALLNPLYDENFLSI